MTIISFENSFILLRPHWWLGLLQFRRAPSPEMARGQFRIVKFLIPFDLEKHKTPTSNVVRFFGGLVDKNKNYFIRTSTVDKNIPAIFHKSSLPV